MITCARTSRRRAGFTLFELVLVLAALVVVLGISVPVMTRFIAEQTLRDDVEDVRTELGGTRYKAIDAGLVYQFRFEPGGQKYVVLPFDRVEMSSETSADGQAMVNAVASGMVRVYSGELSSTSRFEAEPETQSLSETGVLPTEQLPDEWLVLLPDGSSLKQTAWSLPILFYPDGTAEDATFRIVDEDARYQTISLRGLTGSVSVLPVEREAE
ncbi:hypothetical protein Mal4_20620 [Maioricimonas rarisocia]|uniref:Type II secretion system protein H n=1 Tax=Maioricimonas rarisocia TaxID=2528026 RepID=A0A517Z5K8_9PLAN|nr:hypothetical protein [Maioricimonas rarisocia]QDU37745.1 hypothetical protein Mal4_20620 [Maioricimonas rarisocia]